MKLIIDYFKGISMKLIIDYFKKSPILTLNFDRTKPIGIVTDIKVNKKGVYATCEVSSKKLKNKLKEFSLVPSFICISGQYILKDITLIDNKVINNNFLLKEES